MIKRDGPRFTFHNCEYTACSGNRFPNLKYNAISYSVSGKTLYHLFSDIDAMIKMGIEMLEVGTKVTFEFEDVRIGGTIDKWIDGSQYSIQGDNGTKYVVPVHTIIAKENQNELQS
ncbi:hypothetical protein DRO61_04910 [Candidatus Bathyarchaeota archaeon]|nr:MAG: hypothetical protein DRO61_04910 [Candidatus Bathyarchaeota archaeon]